MTLTKRQEYVLRFLYERKDAPPSLSAISGALNIKPSEVRTTLTELRELGMVSGPPTLADRVRETLQGMDPKFGPLSPSFAEHAVLIASVFIDPVDDDLADELGYDKEFVRTVGSRLRAAGIWRAGKLSAERLALWERDGVAFWLDGAIARGSLKRAGGPDDDPRYQMTTDGIADVKRMMP